MKRLRIHEHFATLQDPRVDRRKLHALMDVAIIALLAVITGAEGWSAPTREAPSTVCVYALASARRSCSASGP